MAGFEPADNFERELALGILQNRDQKELYKENFEEVELMIRKTTSDRSVSRMISQDDTVNDLPIIQLTSAMRKNRKATKGKWSIGF